MARKPKLQSYIVHMKSTVIEAYTVDAISEADAHAKAMAWQDLEFSNEVERPDWEVETVTPNE